MSTIREILDRKGRAVLTIHSDASVLEAIGIMSNSNVGALVIQDGDHPEGIFTSENYRN